jgi:hypothetical protein
MPAALTREFVIEFDGTQPGQANSLGFITGSQAMADFPRALINVKKVEWNLAPVGINPTA